MHMYTLCIVTHFFLLTAGASPYETLLVADAGDVHLTMYNVLQAADDIYQQYNKLLSTGCKLLTVGGDHTITYPILKAYRVSYALYKLLSPHEYCLAWYKFSCVTRLEPTKCLLH